MRAKEIFGMLIPFFFAFSFVSCNEDEEAEVGKIVAMTVSSKLVWVESESSSYEKDLVMECIVEGADETLYLDKMRLKALSTNPDMTIS